MKSKTPPARKVHDVHVEIDGDTATPSDPTLIRVMLVDDHEMLSSSLAFVLDAESDMTVVGTATTAALAVPRATTCLPDVVLLDQRLPDGDGISLIGPLLATSSRVKVVMLTANTSDHVLVAAIEAGASGFIDKSRGIAEVVAAVRAAAAGESLISPKLLARLLPRFRGHDGGPTSPLTDRERELLQHLAEGLSNAEIAARMSISVHTVRNHIVNISGKLGAHSKLEILAIAIRQGLVAG